MNDYFSGKKGITLDPAKLQSICSCKGRFMIHDNDWCPNFKSRVRYLAARRTQARLDRDAALDDILEDIHNLYVPKTASGGPVSH